MNNTKTKRVQLIVEVETQIMFDCHLFVHSSTAMNEEN